MFGDREPQLARVEFIVGPGHVYQAAAVEHDDRPADPHADGVVGILVGDAQHQPQGGSPGGGQGPFEAVLTECLKAVGAVLVDPAHAQVQARPPGAQVGTQQIGTPRRPELRTLAAVDHEVGISDGLENGSIDARYSQHQRGILKVAVHPEPVHSRQVEGQRSEFGADAVADNQSSVHACVRVVGNDQAIEKIAVLPLLADDASGRGLQGAEFLQFEDVDSVHHELPHIVELRRAIAAEYQTLVRPVSLVRIVAVRLGVADDQLGIHCRAARQG